MEGGNDPLIAGLVYAAYVILPNPPQTLRLPHPIALMVLGVVSGSLGAVQVRAEATSATVPVPPWQLAARRLT